MKDVSAIVYTQKEFLTHMRVIITELQQILLVKLHYFLIVYIKELHRQYHNILNNQTILFGTSTEQKEKYSKRNPKIFKL